MIISCTTSGKNHRFKVSSQTLCTASSVFRAMLGPTSKFKEAQDLRNYGGADKLYEIPLEDDNLKVLRHILLCLHLQNLAVPNTISFEELVQAAVVTDKYDLGVALRFVGETWMAKWKNVSIALTGHMIIGFWCRGCSARRPSSIRCRKS